MDNLPAHKRWLNLIQSAGASVLNLSPYSPDFNPIELWWSQLKAFYVSSQPPKWLTYCLLLHLIWLISTSKLVYKLLLLYFINLEYAVSLFCHSKQKKKVSVWSGCGTAPWKKSSLAIKEEIPRNATPLAKGRMNNRRMVDYKAKIKFQFSSQFLSSHCGCSAKSSLTLESEK